MLRVMWQSLVRLASDAGQPLSAGTIAFGADLKAGTERDRVDFPVVIIICLCAVHHHSFACLLACLLLSTRLHYCFDFYLDISLIHLLPALIQLIAGLQARTRPNIC